jgi:hypothetical protein
MIKNHAGGWLSAIGVGSVAAFSPIVRYILISAITIFLIVIAVYVLIAVSRRDYPDIKVGKFSFKINKKN